MSQCRRVRPAPLVHEKYKGIISSYGDAESGVKFMQVEMCCVKKNLMFLCGLLNSLSLFNKSWNLPSLTLHLIGNILICSNYWRPLLRPESIESKQVHHR